MNEDLIVVKNLKKWFPVRLGFFQTLISRKSLFVKAVDGVSFEIKRGEIFGLAGESGSGKTTTGKILVKLLDPTKGKIFFEGKDITSMPERQLKPLRRKMQIIFQDPY
ncbi:MAG: ATP-binding cassette domain-containing protein, partial [Candidatus Bathyarchaeia archaeon]